MGRAIDAVSSNAYVRRLPQRQLRQDCPRNAWCKVRGRQKGHVLIRLFEKLTEGPAPFGRPSLGPCWLWGARIDKGGYGSFWHRNSMRGAHRVCFELLVGDVPQGLELDHLCRVRHCVNPSHLDVVTHAENARRGLSPHVGGAHQSQKTHCPKGHAYAVHAYWVKSGCRMCKECNRQRAQARRDSGYVCPAWRNGRP